MEGGLPICKTVDDSCIIVLSDDEEEEEVEIRRDDVEDRVEEQEEEQPTNWLPDGWIEEVNRGDDGTNYQYYTSPVSRFTFRMKSEVLNYLFSEMDERFIETKDFSTQSMLPKTHEWLPKGWLVEVRAGGEKMDKMYKIIKDVQKYEKKHNFVRAHIVQFYLYPAIGLRLLSKEDVLLYVKEMKVSQCDMDRQCDTSSGDNILATVEFNPSALPQGWVKEIVFRKTKEGIRKDPYYTDPVSHYVFRTLKSATCYLETGKITKRAFIQKTSVHDLYSFEKSADLHECLRRRLTNNWKEDEQATRSSKLKNSAQEKLNWDNNSEEVYTYPDSDSSFEPRETRYRSMKSIEKAASCSKRVKRLKEKTCARKTHGKTDGRDTQSEQEENMVKKGR